MALQLIRYPLLPHILPSQISKSGHSKARVLGSSIRAQESKNGEGGNGRKIWRRRTLRKKDDKVRYKIERIPFLEEQVRKIRETGKIMAMDIERLLLSEENRFDFVNEVAAEANEMVDNNRDEYGSKKPILHVLSNRINEAGFYRSEAYMDPDPYKPRGVNEPNLNEPGLVKFDSFSNRTEYEPSQ